MDRSKGRSDYATGCKTVVKRPRQNRCTPFGTIEATRHRGTLMGNRGDLHAPDGTLGKKWKSSRWISCILDGGGWRVPMDTPGRNYPLFFHDEAVALAAGHRPCGECRPDALSAFITAWKVGQGLNVHDYVPLQAIDRSLHHARISEARRRCPIDLDAMPDGAFVWASGFDARPLLKWCGHLWPWQHGGYSDPIQSALVTGEVFQLTSYQIIAVIRAGYRPTIDPALQRDAKSKEAK